jgi:hypothetical protein
MPGSPVLTLGPVTAAEDLQPGQRIITRSGARRIGTISRLPAAAVEVVDIAPSALAPGLPDVALRVPADQALLLPPPRAAITGGDPGQPAAEAAADDDPAPGTIPVLVLPAARSVAARSLAGQPGIVLSTRTAALVLVTLDSPDALYAACVALPAGGPRPD